MLGSDPAVLISANIVLILCFIAFCAFVLPSNEYSILWGIITGILLLFSILNLWLTAATEPGIIPRVPKNVKVNPPENAVIGPLGYRYCISCNIYRPPRSKHCTSCNNCCLKFDHHCAWTSNCIGVRNYRFFLRFVLTITILCAVVFSLCVLSMVTSARHHKCKGPLNCITTALAWNIAATVVAIICCLSIWSLQTLSCYHMMLLKIGQTTNEHLRRVYNSRTNPYDMGCSRNIAHVCCDYEHQAVGFMQKIKNLVVGKK